MTELMPKKEIIDELSKALDRIELEDETAAAICGTALGMPFFLMLLADIRDVLVKIENQLYRAQIK